MKHEMKKVREFHEKYGLSPPTQFPTERDEVLASMGRDVVAISKYIENTYDFKEDQRALRAHLLLEEAGETIVAMAEAREVESLDGLTDLLYVLVGTAVTLQWPLAEAFDEVHSSNMTKARKSDDPGRIRDKGTSFRPPDLERVLREGEQPYRDPAQVMIDEWNTLPRDEHWCAMTPHIQKIWEKIR